MTDSDWETVRQTNVENYDFDTPDTFVIENYIKEVIAEPETWGVSVPTIDQTTYIYGCYKKYVEYCDMVKKKPVFDRQFWRIVHAMADAGRFGTTQIKAKKRPTGFDNPVKIFGIKNPKTKAQAIDLTAIPDDIPF